MEKRVENQHPLEAFMGPPSLELRIVEVTGAKLFPAWKFDEVVVFVEYNGYRKVVKFPATPATPTQEKT